ncbi:hypothetical protein [Rhizobium leguminosarum]|uniref:hypothetical protein n=1 Tax=Rhizobium leguminosarum TaxID=384 RepID=UPI001C94D9E7|nr:hypothetical protein [Rhizobium leguminosarum]MBY5625932.1 hypothetical protein [Rhizobium leguminosarum]
MFRLNLGSGAVAFEMEGDADRVSSLDPVDLAARKWPPEVVENYRRYQERAMQTDTSGSSLTTAAGVSSNEDFQ